MPGDDQYDPPLASARPIRARPPDGPGAAHPIAPLTDAVADAERSRTPTRSPSASSTPRIAAGARVVGHKIGLTSLAVQEQLGVDEPDYGALLDVMELADGATIDAGPLHRPAGRAGAGLPARRAAHRTGRHRGRRAPGDRRRCSRRSSWSTAGSPTGASAWPIRSPTARSSAGVRARRRAMRTGHESTVTAVDGRAVAR